MGRDPRNTYDYKPLEKGGGGGGGQGKQMGFNFG